MRATAELQVIPISAGVSAHQQVKQVVELLQGYDFILETRTDRAPTRAGKRL